MDKTRRYLLLFLTITTAIISALLFMSSGNSAKAASPVIYKIQHKDISARKQAENPVTDLVIDGIEVTQAIQDLNNSIPLIMGKRTYVRVYTHSTNGTYPTTARLIVQVGNSSVALLPIAPGGPFINVRTNPLRIIPSHAFLFEVPNFLTYFAQVTMTAEINPTLYWHAHDPEEYSYSNNTLTKSFVFNEMPPLTLVIASQPITWSNLPFSPTPMDLFYTADWIQRAYPINKLKVLFRTLPTVASQFAPTGNGINVDLSVPNCYMLNSYLAAHRAALLGNSFYPGNLGLYAMVSDTIGFMRGCAPVGGYWLNMNTKVRVGSGPSGDNDHGWDYDGTYADWYGGHELGHAFSQPHVRGGPGYVEDGCGGEAKASKHWTDGRISPTLNFSDPKAVFGFDLRQLYLKKPPVLGPNWHDMMTYCDYQWISSLTYLFLDVVMKYNLPLDQASVPNQPEVQDVLGVFGAINQTTGEVTLQPTSILYSVPDVLPPDTGNYAIVLYDINGNELERYRFNPKGIEAGQSDEPGPETQYAYISELVPYVARTSSIQVQGPGGNILAQVSAGSSAPILEVTAPVRGSVEDGDTVRVAWNASDPDGDSLTFNIEYSSDNGASWEPAGLFLTGNEAIIDQNNLPAGNLAIVRISASDGINTTRATSDVFTVPNRAPTGEIIQPATDITVAVSQTVSFEARVYDIDLGTLDGTNIQWSSNLDGYLGPDAVFNTDSLSVGTHLITMTADDGQGGVITDQVGVTVVPTPDDLPAQPDALSVGPDPVFLEPFSGIPTATIFVDNLNLGHAIGWNASADHPWVQLGAISGTTPDDFTVSADLTQLEFGTYHAVITFTSPSTQESVELPVVLTIPKYTFFLPFTTK